MAGTSRTYRSPRREQDAARTREEILAAARTLFAEQGYVRVTVSEVARRAGTAVKTVYASVGTKTDLLVTLLDDDMDASGADRTIEGVRAAGDLATAMRRLAAGTRLSNESQRAAVEMLFSALGSHDAADRAWVHVVERYRASLRDAAQHCHDHGMLAPGLDVESATDRLWFSLGIWAWRALVVDCGWSFDRAEAWLAGQATSMLGGGPDQGP
jgi:AcrR family transcriptional regulator